MDKINIETKTNDFSVNIIVIDIEQLKFKIPDCIDINTLFVNGVKVETSDIFQIDEWSAFSNKLIKKIELVTKLDSSTAPTPDATPDTGFRRITSSCSREQQNEEIKRIQIPIIHIKKQK